MARTLKITADQARRFVLERHGLIRPLASPLDVVRNLVAVQTQYAMSFPVAVGARSRIDHKWEEEQTNRAKSLVKTWSLRSTIHVHAAEDHGLILSAMGRRKYDRYKGWMQQTNPMRGDRFHALQAKIEAALEGKALTRVELHERVPELKDVSYTGWGVDVHGLAYLGKLVIAPAGPGQTRFILSRDWFGYEPTTSLGVTEANAELFRRYMRGYGPITLQDFAYWLGAPMAVVRQSFELLSDEIETVEIDGHSGQRWILAEDVPLLTENRKPHHLSLLAKFDPLIMGYRDKTLFLPAADFKRVSRAAGQVEATILRKGVVAGTWRLERKGRTAVINVEQHKGLSKGDLERLERAATRLARPLGLQSVKLGKIT